MKKRLTAMMLAALLLFAVPVLADGTNGLDTGIISVSTAVYDGIWDGANVVGTLQAGTGVIILQGYGTWLQVHARGDRVVGWVPAANVQVDSATIIYPGVVISQNVSLREQPSTSARRIMSISNGSILELLDEQNGWYYVAYWDAKSSTPYEGWVLVDYVVRDPAYITTTKSTYVYATPSRSAKKVGQLVSGTQLVVIGEYDDFWVVNLRSASGFIYKRDVEDNQISGGNG